MSTFKKLVGERQKAQNFMIVPDMEIKPTIEGIRLGKYELLDKAKEIINGEN